MKQAIVFVPFDAAKQGIGTVFRARGQGFEADVVVNQFGQVLDADKRQALPWEPSEMSEPPKPKQAPAGEPKS